MTLTKMASTDDLEAFLGLSERAIWEWPEEGWQLPSRTQLEYSRVKGQSCSASTGHLRSASTGHGGVGPVQLVHIPGQSRSASGDHMTAITGPGISLFSRSLPPPPTPPWSELSETEVQGPPNPISSLLPPSPLMSPLTPSCSTQQNLPHPP